MWSRRPGRATTADVIERTAARHVERPSCVVEPVAMRPSRLVTAQRRQKRHRFEQVTVALRFASIGMFKTARWSAIKKASNFAVAVVQTADMPN